MLKAKLLLLDHIRASGASHTGMTGNGVIGSGFCTIGVLGVLTSLLPESGLETLLACPLWPPLNSTGPIVAMFSGSLGSLGIPWSSVAADGDRICTCLTGPITRMPVSARFGGDISPSSLLSGRALYVVPLKEREWPPFLVVELV